MVMVVGEQYDWLTHILIICLTVFCGAVARDSRIMVFKFFFESAFVRRMSSQLCQILSRDFSDKNSI